MECKDGYFVFNEKTGMVLIETLWNVKLQTFSNLRLGWYCINRNIVECKANKAGIISEIIARINRNIVECKVIQDRKNIQVVDLY